MKRLQPDGRMNWRRKSAGDALALALITGILAVGVVLVIFPNVRPKVKPTNIKARNNVSQFVVDLPLQAIRTPSPDH